MPIRSLTARRSLRSWATTQPRLRGAHRTLRACARRADARGSFPLKEKVYTLWDFFLPAFQCPFRVSRIGRLGDGGKWVCGVEELAKQDACVIYSFGASFTRPVRRAPLRVGLA
jgi:hypothetical protein